MAPCAPVTETPHWSSVQERSGTNRRQGTGPQGWGVGGGGTVRERVEGGKEAGLRYDSLVIDSVVLS